MATRFKPDEPVERQILAELYEATEQLDDGHRRALSRSSRRTRCASIRTAALYRLYLEEARLRPRRGACARRSRSCTRPTRRSSASSRTTARSGMIQVKSRLDNEQWVKNLFHKDENLFIGKIFEMIAAAAIVAKTQAAREGEAAAGARRALQAGSGDVAPSRSRKTFGWAAQVLGVPLPELYVRNDVPGALVAVPSRPPASRRGSDACSPGFTPQELTFIVGKHLAYLPRRALHQEPLPDGRPS